MRVLTFKDSDLLSRFVELKENIFIITSFKKILIDDHTLQANKGKVSGHLRLEQTLGFCGRFTERTKGLGFQPRFETTDLQNILYTTLPVATVINVNIIHLRLFAPMVKPSPEIQSNFNISVKNSLTLSFDSWTTDRKVFHNQLEYQLDIGSAPKTNCPKHAAHQTSDRSAASNKAINAAIFHKLAV